MEGPTLSYHWANVVPGFDMPVKVSIPAMGTRLPHPIEAWQTPAVTSPRAAEVVVDENIYVTTRNLAAPAAPGTGGTR